MNKINLYFCVLHILFWRIESIGRLPDASQEGILKQFNDLDDMALFHYTVPPDTTRATWEFASFQDEAGCPSRDVMIYLRHGSFPVLTPDNATFTDKFLHPRDDMHYIKTQSSYQPHDSAVFPIYNPEPGSWFAFAFLSPYEEKITQQGLLHKCRYSLGSIALWTKADQVEDIIPFKKKLYSTKKHFSYFKFYVPENINSFNLEVAGCTVVHKIQESILGVNNCIEYLNLAANALPRHDPDIQGFQNISKGGGAVFDEKRPYKGTTYYLLVVSTAVIKFSLELQYTDCGEIGLYGGNQDGWYLTEQGLKFNDSSDAQFSKEPEDAFSLFSVENKDTENSTQNNYDLENTIKKNFNNCFAEFQFNRVDLVEDFSVKFILQGKTWYTKWITVSNRFPIMTRFRTHDYTDIGGTLNLVMRLDDLDVADAMQQLAEDGQIIRVYACVSHGRYPEIKGGMLECDPGEKILIDTDVPVGNVTRMIPFPAPGLWFVGIQVECLNPSTRAREECWGNRRYNQLMASLEIHLQPCGYRSQEQICGDFGVCVRSHKSNFLYTSCRCASGYRGWACDQTKLDDPAAIHQSNTLLLTLSNLSFLPAIILSVWYKLYTESLLYTSTMFFSVFYHTCDQEINQKHLPELLEKACAEFYSKKEVVQFCDFFCAILSFWVTIITMARLPDKLVNFLHMFGVLLIAVLVQYNRNGMQVIAVPIPLGVAVLFISIFVRCYQRKKLLRANRSCTVWVSLALLSAISAVLVFAFVETTTNYQYVHSVWHCLISMSLVFLLPYCRTEKRKLTILASSSMRSVETEILQMTSDPNSGTEMTSGGPVVTSGSTDMTSGGTGMTSGGSLVTSGGTEMILTKTSTRTEEERSIIASVSNLDD